ncbi:MAG: dihydrofolate reductase family protein [Gemmatimonadota bacterium]
MNLTVQTFVTLDGVMQAPGGVDEDTSGGFELGGWQAPLGDEETFEVIADRYRRASALLLGRRTYDIFASYWPDAPDETEPFRSLVNDLPKHVASRSEPELTWADCHWIGPDAASGVRELEARPDGELLVPGSANLVQTLLDEDLVDELELITYPVVLGQGRRLFQSGLNPSAWELAECSSMPQGAVVCVYRFAGRPEFGDM